MSSRPTTQRDLANHTGLSLMTVSRILREDIEKFDPRTVERVRRAAKELRYDLRVPGMAATSSPQSESRSAPSASGAHRSSSTGFAT